MILFTFFYIIIAAILITMFVYILRRPVILNNDFTKDILWLVAVGILAVISYTAFLFSDGYYMAFFFNTLYYICTTWLTYIMLIISHTFVGNKKKLPLRYFLMGLCAADSISLFVNMFTFHSYDLVMLVYSIYHQYWGIALTSFHLIHLGLCYTMVVATFVFLILGVIKTPSFYNQKFAWLLGIYALVIVSNGICYTLNSPIDFSLLLYAAVVAILCYNTIYAFPHVLVTHFLDNVNEKIGDGIVFFDEHGKYSYSNRTARLILVDDSGVFTPKEAEDYAREWKSIHPENEKNGMDSFAIEDPITHEINELHFTVEYQNLEFDGTKIGSFFKFVNKTEEIAQYLKEKYDATHDKLTGLYNRTGFFEKVQDIQIGNRRNDKNEYLMLFSNIKDFKLVNEIFDTKFGDEVLKLIAKLLRENMLNDAVVGRVGDDKFAMYMRRENFTESVFLRELDKVYALTKGSQYKLKIMIGIYDSPFTTESPQIMCDKAQIACERLSNDYQTTFSWYDKALMDKIDAEKNIVDEFENALENRQFKIYLQPQLAFVGTEQEKYFGAEVLVCWEHPQHGTLMPETFLPTLEKTGLIYKLDRFVWEEAAKKLYEWNERGFQNQTVSVNISQKDIYYIDVYKTFTELVEKYNIRPMQMNIEISESGFMSDFEGSKKLFEKLQSFGFKVEIDDFGSGYSSLNMLKDIHADVLKIGRSFLNESENKERSNTILYTIIDMAKSLGMDVLAVGVESESQMNLMKTLGCESFQGFYFSKPVPVESFERMYL
ncbi:MAG: bifunctional diguanylate cyclase/phosphodiesterase [Treponema sp.]|nr:bifunctional diguanylate cyclase/phosphodiesterase [Treponema sp.]